MRIPYEAEMVITAPNTNNLDVKTEKFPDNKLFCLQRVGISNDTTDTKTATVGVIIGTNIRWIETITLTTHALWYPFNDPIWIRTCKGVVIRFNSPTSGDVLRANVFGYFEE